MKYEMTFNLADVEVLEQEELWNGDGIRIDFEYNEERYRIILVDDEDNPTGELTELYSDVNHLAPLVRVTDLEYDKTESVAIEEEHLNELKDHILRLTSN
ncbi:hypothetical protein N0M98_09395 [Paenibacillus doosanensis]|uniref:hypothetical protein n=1 Tax=Paenibacillus doosanensis TaxID=1229154 RepID=UPI00218085D6|nr:hypothetical protein [Paenibacillus doosanensis]MCS7460355.1 hypothetical protein [Paenibacillus doosanensis]